MKQLLNAGPGSYRLPVTDPNADFDPNSQRSKKLNFLIRSYKKDTDPHVGSPVYTGGRTSNHRYLVQDEGRDGECGRDAPAHHMKHRRSGLQCLQNKYPV